MAKILKMPSKTTRAVMEEYVAATLPDLTQQEAKELTDDLTLVIKTFALAKPEDRKQAVNEITEKISRPSDDPTFDRPVI